MLVHWLAEINIHLSWLSASFFSIYLFNVFISVQWLSSLRPFVDRLVFHFCWLSQMKSCSEDCKMWLLWLKVCVVNESMYGSIAKMWMLVSLVSIYCSAILLWIKFTVCVFFYQLLKFYLVFLPFLKQQILLQPSPCCITACWVCFAQNQLRWITHSSVW